MDVEGLPGYRGLALDVLRRAGVRVGDSIRVRRGGDVFEGILMPRTEYGDEFHIVLKLSSGYNVGIRVTPDTVVERVGAGERLAFVPPPPPPTKPGLPRVSFISTGGTIASRVDYRTGGVRVALTAEDLYSIIPEASDIAIVEAEVLFNLFSENLAPKHWVEIAGRVAERIKGGVDGVVVAHGTDTMAYTSAALSFALRGLPVPVLLVGSQRSSDRPSSDAAVNFIGAVTAASRGPFAEVAVAMHETTSDEAVAVHRGTRVRKCHTSRRDAFRSINITPIARVVDGRVEMLVGDYQRRDPNRELELMAKFEEKVALLKFYPGMNPAIIDWLVDEGYRGLILEGTGLGHVGRYCFDAVKRAIKEGVVVAMTSQCIWGRVNMNVYDTGRDLLAMGVLPLEDMIPETALVKLMWVLGSLTQDPEDAKKYMLANFAGEINPRSPMESTAPTW